MRQLFWIVRPTAFVTAEQRIVLLKFRDIFHGIPSQLPYAHINIRNWVLLVIYRYIAPSVLIRFKISIFRKKIIVICCPKYLQAEIIYLLSSTAQCTPHRIYIYYLCVWCKECVNIFNYIAQQLRIDIGAGVLFWPMSSTHFVVLVYYIL